MPLLETIDKKKTSMPWVKAVLCSLLLAIGWEPLAAAETTIADFAGDFLAGASAGQGRAERSADGWNYLWNSNGEIGVASHYSKLVWNPKLGQYCTDSAIAQLPTSEPAAFLFLTPVSGHTGRGKMDGNDINYDRYVIAAFTIPSGKNGQISIVGSSLKVDDSHGNGVELRVYVNDTLKTKFIQAAGADPSSFNMPLGMLKVGDTVYVAFGPNGVDTYDSFSTKFKLAKAP